MSQIKGVCRFGYPRSLDCACVALGADNVPIDSCMGKILGSTAEVVSPRPDQEQTVPRIGSEATHPIDGRVYGQRLPCRLDEERLPPAECRERHPRCAARVLSQNSPCCHELYGAGVPTERDT
jgi:hypothetical protein